MSWVLSTTNYLKEYFAFVSLTQNIRILNIFFLLNSNPQKNSIEPEMVKKTFFLLWKKILVLFFDAYDFKLEHFRVATNFKSVYYIPNFISENDGNFLLKKIQNAPDFSWKKLKFRKSQMWGGIPAIAKNFKPEPIPVWYINVFFTLIK